jgi:hypothetical protein
VRISTTTGFWPAWSADSTRLYYMTADYHFMSVDLAVSGGVLHPAVPKDLFVQTPGINGHFFSFDPIGRRFLIPTSPDATSQPTSAPLVVITNWTSTLKKAR